ncbi:MAG: hypothetical protein JST22_06865 [Bacteroidetes bacterium]|nr:hypothetical protein [Bacteroidota bacterium]
MTVTRMAKRNMREWYRRLRQYCASRLHVANALDDIAEAITGAPRIRRQEKSTVMLCSVRDLQSDQEIRERWHMNPDRYRGMMFASALNDLKRAAITYGHTQNRLLDATLRQDIGLMVEIEVTPGVPWHILEWLRTRKPSLKEMIREIEEEIQAALELLQAVGVHTERTIALRDQLAECLTLIACEVAYARLVLDRDDFENEPDFRDEYDEK